MIRQNAVFDRTEQRFDNTEQEQRDEQDRNGMQPKAGDGERSHRYLDALQSLRHIGFVVAVSDLAAD